VGKRRSFQPFPSNRFVLLAKDQPMTAHQKRDACALAVHQDSLTARALGQIPQRFNTAPIWRYDVDVRGAVN
jgi:hypothetical protein